MTLNNDRGPPNEESHWEHAEECRTIAKQMKDEQREQLLEMARTWDKLAEERSGPRPPPPGLAQPGGHREEMRLPKRR